MYRFQPYLTLALFLLLTAAGSNTAHAYCNVFGCPYMIDDFTQGALQPADGPFDFTHVGLPDENCYGGSRRLWVNDAPGASAGMILVGGGDFAFQVTASEQAPVVPGFSNNHAALVYEFSEPTDLTASGLNDYLVVDVLDVNQFSGLVMFHYPGGASGWSEILQPGANVWPLDEILGDPTQITKIEVFFHYHGPETFEGVLTANRIRVIGDGSENLMLWVPDWLEYMPPFNLPGPYMSAYVQDDNGGFEEIQMSQLTLTSALQFTAEGSLVGDFPTRLGADAAGSLDLGVLPSAGYAVDVGQDGWVGTGDLLVFLFDLAYMGAGLNRVTAVSYPPDPIQPNPDEMLMPISVDYSNHNGVPMGRAEYRMRIQTRDESALDLEDATFYPPDPIDDPDFSFELKLRHPGTAKTTVDGDELYTITLEADWTPPTPVSAVPGTGATGPAMLTAHPTVTDSRTVLQYSRTEDRAAVINIYDLAGRLVRELHVAAGQPSVAWDTRDEQGRPVTSGMYFARAGGGMDRVALKITVHR